MNWLLSYENNVNDKSVTCATNEKQIPEYKQMSLALENSGVELTTNYIKMKLLQEGYNRNPMASYSSENVLVSHYKCRKSTEYNKIERDSLFKTIMMSGGHGDIIYDIITSQVRNLTHICLRREGRD
jgi:hypothetical protein